MSDRRRAPGLAGAFEAPGPVHEDAGDDRKVGDGDGLLDREAVSRRPSAVRGGTREAGSGAPGPARVPAAVACHHRASGYRARETTVLELAALD